VISKTKPDTYDGPIRRAFQYFQILAFLFFCLLLFAFVCLLACSLVREIIKTLSRARTVRKKRCIFNAPKCVNEGRTDDKFIVSNVPSRVGIRARARREPRPPACTPRIDRSDI